MERERQRIEKEMRKRRRRDKKEREMAGETKDKQIGERKIAKERKTNLKENGIV